MSPLLFKINSEFIFREEGIEHFIKVNVHIILGILITYAIMYDDTMIFTNNIIKIQYLVDKVIEISERNELTLYAMRTKFMMVSENRNVGEHLMNIGIIP